jgi:hypothetical protein
MRTATKELLAYLEQEKGYPKHLTPTIGQIVECMVKRSPSRRHHIYDVIKNLEFDHSSGKELPQTKYSNSTSRTCQHMTGLSSIDFEGDKIVGVQPVQVLTMNYKIDPNVVDDVRILAHELGHAVNWDYAFDYDTYESTVKTNVTTKKARLVMSPELHNIDVSCHARGLGEVVNNVNTYDLLKRMYGHEVEISGYEVDGFATAFLDMLSKKYNLKDALLEADEQQNYEIIRDAVNKRASVKTSLFPNKEPAEVLTDYCEDVHNLMTNAFLAGRHYEPIDSVFQLSKQTGEYFKLI